MSDKGSDYFGKIDMVLCNVKRQKKTNCRVIAFTYFCPETIQKNNMEEPENPKTSRGN